MSLADTLWAVAACVVIVAALVITAGIYINYDPASTHPVSTTAFVTGPRRFVTRLWHR